MDYHYIILVGDESLENHAHALAVPDAALCSAGMQCRFSSTSIRIFTSSDTPTQSIPGQGLIIGQVFTKDGRPIANAQPFEHETGEIAGHLLQNHWGEYLAFQVGEDGRGSTLLRDPSGGVPCVYSIENGTGFITSDISLAIELGLNRRQVDWRAITHGLNFPYLRTERTALLGVSELLPGCVLHCRGANISVKTAWSPWKFVGQNTRHSDPRAAAADVRTAVSTVVKTLAAVDDRFLVQLSGGLDSSIVAACLREASDRAIFCSLVMPVAGTDERPYAKLVTDSLSRELVSVQVGFENVRFDFPTPPSSVVPAIGVLHHATNQVWEAAGSKYGADSFFSGSGGDTVFCYLRTAAPATDAFRERGPRAGIAAIRDISALHQCTVWKAGRLGLKKLWHQPQTMWKADSTLLNPSRLAMTHEIHPWMDAPPDALPGDREKIYDLIGTQLYRHARPRGASRSVRYPLLSQPVMEACLKVPTWMWISDGQNRAIARAAFSGILPDGIRDRRSKGSYTGYLAAVYARNKAKIREFLEDGQLCAHDLLDRAALAKFFSSELAPRDQSFLRTFDLCTAENWLRGQAQTPP